MRELTTGDSDSYQPASSQTQTWSDSSERQPKNVWSECSSSLSLGTISFFHKPMTEQTNNKRCICASFSLPPALQRYIKGMIKKKCNNNEVREKVTERERERVELSGGGVDDKPLRRDCSLLALSSGYPTHYCSGFSTPALAEVVVMAVYFDGRVERVTPFASSLAKAGSVM